MVHFEVFEVPLFVQTLKNFARSMISNSISINRNVTMAVNIPTLIYALQNARDYLPTNILRLNPYQAIVAKSYFSVTRGWGYFIPS